MLNDCARFVLEMHNETKGLPSTHGSDTLLAMQSIGADMFNFSVAYSSLTEQIDCDTCSRHLHTLFWNAFASWLAKNGAKSNDFFIHSMPFVSLVHYIGTQRTN